MQLQISTQYVMFQAVLLEDPTLLSSSTLKACLFYPVSPLPGFFSFQSPWWRQAPWMVYLNVKEGKSVIEAAPQ